MTRISVALFGRVLRDRAGRGAAGDAAAHPSRTAAADQADRAGPGHARLAGLQLRPRAHRLEPRRDRAVQEDRRQAEAACGTPSSPPRPGPGPVHPDRAGGGRRRRHPGVASKDLVFSISIEDTLSAVDAATGQIVWQKNFPNPLKPLRPPIDQLLQHRAGDAGDRQGQGRDLLHHQRRQAARRQAGRRRRGAASHRHGAALQPQLEPEPGGRCGLYHHGARLRRQPPRSPSNTAPWRRWTFPIPPIPSLSRFYTGKGRPAGPWGASGVAWGPQGAYVSTADGPNNPGSGVYGDMVLAIRPHAWGLNDSFTPTHWKYVNARDLDFGSGGVLLFPFGKRNIVATGLQGIGDLSAGRRQSGRGRSHDRALPVAAHGQ